MLTLHLQCTILLALYGLELLPPDFATNMFVYHLGHDRKDISSMTQDFDCKTADGGVHSTYLARQNSWR